MVPPPRNYAADAHECIMGSGRKARRIQGCGAMILRPRYGSPRDFRLAEPMAAPRAPDNVVKRRPTRETSLLVSRKSTREGAHVHVRLEEGARLVDEWRPCPHARGDGRKIRREMGVISAHRSRPPIVVAGQTLVKAGLRPPPPAAIGLYKGPAIDKSRCREIEGQERAASPTPVRPTTKPDAKPLFAKEKMIAQVRSAIRLRDRGKGKRLTVSQENKTRRSGHLMCYQNRPT